MTKTSNNTRMVLFSMPKGAVKTLEEVCKALGGTLISSEGAASKPTIKSWKALCTYIEDRKIDSSSFIDSMLSVSKEATFAFLLNLIHEVNRNAEYETPSEGTLEDFIYSQRIILDNLPTYQEILGDKFLTLLHDSKGKQEDKECHAE